MKGDKTMDMKCQRCGKPTTSYKTINLTHKNGEQETICEDCYNAEMAFNYDIEDFNDFIRTYSISDSDGIPHKFDISKRIMGSGVFWEAREIKEDGSQGYLFGVDTEMDGDQHEAVQKLYQKIKKGLEVKYIDTKELFGQRVKSISGNTVVGRIEWDDQCENDRVPAFIIDGKRVALSEFGHLLLGCEGFNFKLEIIDITDDAE